MIFSASDPNSIFGQQSEFTRKHCCVLPLHLYRDLRRLLAASSAKILS